MIHQTLQGLQHDLAQALAAKVNVFEAAQFLEKSGVATSLITPNLDFYGKIVIKALKSSKNDKDVESKVSELTGANIVKLDRSSLLIADKIFKIDDLGYEKIDLINQLKVNQSSHSNKLDFN